MHSIHLSVAVRTDRGRARRKNEDAWVVTDLSDGNVLDSRSPDGHIDVEHLPSSVTSAHEAKKQAPGDQPAEALSDEERRRRDELIATLRAHDGNITAAAKAMGKPRTQLQRWLRRWKIDPLGHRR